MKYHPATKQAAIGVCPSSLNSASFDWYVMNLTPFAAHQSDISKNREFVTGAWLYDIEKLRAVDTTPEIPMPARRTASPTARVTSLLPKRSISGIAFISFRCCF